MEYGTWDVEVSRVWSMGGIWLVEYGKCKVGLVEYGTWDGVSGVWEMGGG